MYISNKKPSAYICTNENDRLTRGREKVYEPNSKVYLKDRKEFEIELFNPTHNSVKAVIEINGVNISQGGIILRPGERVYLDCFPDSKKKFIFRTYQVDNSPEVKNAIKNNGDVKVSFYREATPLIVPYVWDWNINTTINQPYNMWYGDNTSPYNTCTLTNSTNTITDTITNSDAVLYQTSMETGRVEKGSDSDQSFTEVSMDFEPWVYASFKFKLLPESERPLAKSDIQSKPKKDITKTSDKIDALTKLARLLDHRHISEEEFNDLKKQIL